MAEVREMEQEPTEERDEGDEGPGEEQQEGVLERARTAAAAAEGLAVPRRWRWRQGSESHARVVRDEAELEDVARVRQGQGRTAWWHGIRAWEHSWCPSRCGRGNSALV